MSAELSQWASVLMAGVALFLSIRSTRKSENEQRIDDRIKAIVNPDLLATTLTRIDKNVTTLDKKMDDLSLDVARMQGREEARRGLPAELSDVAKLHP